MGPQNLHKNGSFCVFIFKWNHRNAITINNSHTRFSQSSKWFGRLWIFQLKFSHSKYMLRSDYWSHLIRLFWEIGSNSSDDQTANIKCHQPKNEIVFSCSQMSQSARQAKKKWNFDVVYLEIVLLRCVWLEFIAFYNCPIRIQMQCSNASHSKNAV